MFLYSFLMPSIFLTTNPSYPISSVLYPCLLSSIFLPPFCSYWSLYTSPAFCMYFIVSFVFCLYSFLSFLSALFLLYVFVYLHTVFLLYVFAYLHTVYLSIQLLFLCFIIHLFFIPFFLFSLLTSSPHSIRLYSCLFLFFFCLCQSLPLYPPTTHVSSCGNVSICIRKVPSSNLSQNTIYQDGEKTVNLPGCRLCKQLSSPMWHVVVF
jgi:hypothetical protein